jgi:pimeloyl-ACP methyl ester carboxylesterase
VLDSALMDLRALPMVHQMSSMLGPQGASMLQMLPDPLPALSALSRVSCPLLILHSREDAVIPFAQAEHALRAAGSQAKQLQAFTGCGHNDLAVRHTQRYVALLAALLSGRATAEEDEATLRALPVRELRLRLHARGLDASGCVEKMDMVALLLKK